MTVQYRVGDILLSASGTLAADSGHSIFLEQHAELKGKRSYFRWEIPYPFIHRLEKVEAAEEESSQASVQAEPEVPQTAVADAGGSSETSSVPTSVPLMDLPH